MSRKIKIDDFIQLGISLKPSLKAHDIPEEHHYSLISDILFQCACMIDDKSGSSHHEKIDGLVDDNLNKFIDGLEDNPFISSIKIQMGVGKQHHAEIYAAHIQDRLELKNLLELLLNIPQTGKSFSDIYKRRKGIESITFTDEIWSKDADWLEVTFPQNGRNSYEESIDGLTQIIIDNLQERYNNRFKDRT